MTKVTIKGNDNHGYFYEILSSGGRAIMKSVNHYSRKRDAIRGARTTVKTYLHNVADIQDLTATSA